MSIFLAELQQLIADLRDLNAQWALVGGLACSAYAEPRTTNDIDIAVAVSTREELDELVEQLIIQGYSGKQLLMQVEPTQRLGVRLQLPSSGRYSVPVDLLSSSSGIESEVVRDAEMIELLPGIFLPVARAGHLLAMKVLSCNDSDRLKDKSDALSLLKVISNEELKRTTEALELMTARNFHREQDLQSKLQALIDAPVKATP